LHKNQGIIYIQTMLNNSKSTKVSSLFLCLLFINLSLAQEQDLSLKLDSISIVLDSLKEEKNIKEYYKSLDIFEREHYKDFPEILYQTSELWSFVGETSQDSVVYRRNLSRRASYFRKINDFDSALKYYLIAHKHGKPKDGILDFSWYIEKPMGSIYARLNAYDQANYYFKLCIPGLEKAKNYKNLSRVYKDIANSYDWNVNQQKAQDYIELARKYAIKSESSIALTSHHTGYARILLENNPIENRELFYKTIKQAQAACHETKGKDPSYYMRMHSIHSMLSEFAFRMESYELARTEMYKSINFAKNYFKSDKSREIAKLYNALAKYDLAEEKYNAGLNNIKLGFAKLSRTGKISSFPSLPLIKRENTFTELFDTQARCYYGLYEAHGNVMHLDSCIMSIDFAIHANKSLEQSLVIRDSKYVSVEINKELVKLALQVLSHRQNVLGEKLENSVLRKYFDLSKGGIYLDRLKERHLVAQMSKNERKRLDSLQARVVALSVSEEEDKDSIKQLITLNQKEIKASISDLMNKNFETVALENYIEYVSSDSTYYMLSDISSGHLFTIDRNHVDGLLRAVINRIKHKEENNFEEKLNLLGDVLMPLELPINTQINIIPDGILHQIPFGVLRKKDKYILEQNAISHQLHHKTTRRNISQQKPIKTFCLYPEYLEDVDIQTAAMRSDLGPLPYAEKEIEFVEATLENVRKSRKLDPVKLQKLFSEYDIFHFAGHAIANDDSLYLAVINNKNEIENVRENQIQFLQNELDLICLSACETGLGEFKDGEGVRSISSSFLNSGAKSVVHTLWTVNDKSTAEVISLFYKYLKQGKNKSEALREAKLHYLKNTDHKGLHPFYWAGIVLSGDDAALFNSDNLLIKLAVGAILFLLIFFPYVTSKLKTP